jgi:hypothetical protein
MLFTALIALLLVILYFAFSYLADNATSKPEGDTHDNKAFDTTYEDIETDSASTSNIQV